MKSGFIRDWRIISPWFSQTLSNYSQAKKCLLKQHRIQQATLSISSKIGCSYTMLSIYLGRYSWFLFFIGSKWWFHFITEVLWVELYPPKGYIEVLARYLWKRPSLEIGSLQILFFKEHVIKLRKYHTRLEWALNPMTIILIRKGIFRDYLET